MAAAASKAQITRAIQALKAAGEPVAGLLCLSDGSTAVLTQAPVLTLPAASEEDWLGLAGDDATEKGQNGAAQGH